MCSTSVRTQRRKIRQVAQLVADHPHGDRDVAEQLAFVGVGKAALVVQLVDLADIVQHHAGDQQVVIDVRVVRRGRLRQPADAEHVLDQAAQKGVMNLLGGGRAAVAARDVLIVQHRVQQALQVRIGDAGDDARAARATSPPGSRLDAGK